MCRAKPFAPTRAPSNHGLDEPQPVRVRRSGGASRHTARRDASPTGPEDVDGPRERPAAHRRRDRWNSHASNTGTRPDAFWRTLMALVMGAGILAGGALAVGPIALLVSRPGTWMLLALIAVPLGVWIAATVGGHARKLLWHYAHRPAVTLFADRI